MSINSKVSSLMVTVLSLMMVALLSVSAFAQLSTCKVEGTVRDMDTGAPLAGVQVVIEGTRLATALVGEAIATNLFMLGYAFQLGLVPLQQSSIMRAIELNGVALESNRKAFNWGRRAAFDPGDRL